MEPKANPRQVLVHMRVEEVYPRAREAFAIFAISDRWTEWGAFVDPDSGELLALPLPLDAARQLSDAVLELPRKES